MSVNDTSMILIDASRVTLQIVTSLTNNSKGSICDRNKFIVQTTKLNCDL